MAQDILENTATSDIEEFTGFGHVDLVMNSANSDIQSWLYTDITGGGAGDVVRQIPKLVREVP